MLCLKVFIRKRSIEFGMGSRNSETDASQHVVSSDPICVMLINLCPNNNSIIVIVISSPPPTGSFLADSFRPSCFIVSSRAIELNVRVIRPCNLPSKIQRSSPWFVTCN